MRSTKTWIIAAAAVVIAGAAVLFSARPSPPAGVALPPAAPRAGASPVLWPVPQFSFADQDDAELSTAGLRGKVWIVDFIFTNCASTCPKMTAQRIKLQKQITDPRVMFLSISVDPERDDRATRKSYAAANHIDESRWRFVSPPDRQAALKTAQAMKIAGASHEHGDSPILHSDRFILIDPHSRIRGTYAMADAQAMDRLAHDALTLAQQASGN